MFGVVCNKQRTGGTFINFFKSYLMNPNGDVCPLYLTHLNYLGAVASNSAKPREQHSCSEVSALVRAEYFWCLSFD